MTGIDPERLGVEVGIVLSNATAFYAPVLLRRDRELDVHEEDLVLVVDERLPSYYMLGVLRLVTRHEPFLRRGVHNVYAEYPEALSEDIMLPFTNAYAEIYAAVCDGSSLCGGARGVEANLYPPTPGSRVYRLTRADELTGYLSVSRPVFVGAHKYTDWMIPLDSSWIPYHIGVFGATGMGKSRLVLRLASEVVRAGYSLIVFDHTGVDYASFARDAGVPVVDASAIQIPAPVFADVLSSLMRIHSSSTLKDYVDIAVVCHEKMVRGEAGSVPDCLGGGGARRRQVQLSRYSGRGRGSGRRWSKEDFGETLREVAEELRAKPATIYKLSILLDYYVPDYLMESMGRRRVSPAEVVDMALSRGLVVVDMSSEREIEVKRAIVTGIAEAAWEKIMAQGERINLGLVVDEAQNYACEYCGQAGRALETIAREGRKWGFFLILASQRIVRDIRPGIRSNLGTVFFSKLQSAGDLQELKGYLDLGRLNEASLAMLSRREFYVAGLMNPLRKPLLLRVCEASGFQAPTRTGIVSRG